MRDGEVERFRRSAPRDDKGGGTFAWQTGGEPVCFRTEKKQRVFRKIHGKQGYSGIAVGCKERVAVFPRKFSKLFDGYSFIDGNPKNRAHGGPNRFRIVGIGAPGREEQCACAKPVARPDDRTKITGILDFVEIDERTPRNCAVECFCLLRDRGDSNDSLGFNSIGDLPELLFACNVYRDVFRTGDAEQRLVLMVALRGSRDQGKRCLRLYRIGDDARSFEYVLAILGPVLFLRKLPDMSRLRIAQRRGGRVHLVCGSVVQGAFLNPGFQPLQLVIVDDDRNEDIVGEPAVDFLDQQA